MRIPKQPSAKVFCLVILLAASTALAHWTKEQFGHRALRAKTKKARPLLVLNDEARAPARLPRQTATTPE
ncbi:MAG: hypothetical protein ABI923_08090 [bacterium]